MVFSMVLVAAASVAAATAAAMPPRRPAAATNPFASFPASNYPSFLEEITFDEPGRKGFTVHISYGHKISAQLRF